MEVDWAFLVLILLSGIRICVGGRRWEAIQKPKPPSFSFPCGDKSLWRSPVPPSSVHALRPGDIDVVAAIGDSLTAGNGAMADNMFDVILRENRGVSWSGGGQSDWRTYLTVPNLLKVMNPKLVGYATGDGRFTSRKSQFNVAFVGAMDQDLLLQARKLVTRMKHDRRVDFKNHWKMITIMMGTNDVCTDYCYYDVQGPKTHRSTLQDVLEYLRDNVPRAYVNLVSMPNVYEYASLVNPPFSTCITMKLIDCLCLFGGRDTDAKFQNVTRMTLDFQEVEKSVGESWKSEPKEDFAVVYQPTNIDSKFPHLPLSKQKNRNDLHDYSYVSIDCIHYSQKLQAMVANTLWNNLFEAPGNKTTKWVFPAYSTFLCPTHEHPYLLTEQNAYLRIDDNQV